jgi:hypothetical protein
MGTPEPKGNLMGFPMDKLMSEFFVAGGIYQDHKGKEWFALVSKNREEPPYVMVDGLKRYFGQFCEKAHLYRVEKDYSLSLVAPSHKALEWGVKAPEKVTLDSALLEKLQSVINLS